MNHITWATATTPIKPSLLKLRIASGGVQCHGMTSEQTLIHIIWGHLHIILKQCRMVPENIFIDFPYIFLCKTLNTYHGPTLSVIVWTKLSVHFMRMLPFNKLKSCDWEEECGRIFLQICIAMENNPQQFWITPHKDHCILVW